MKKPDKHRIAQRLTRGARARKRQAPIKAAPKRRHQALTMPYQMPSAAYLGFGAALAMGAAGALLHDEFDGLFRTLRHPQGR